MASEGISGRAAKIGAEFLGDVMLDGALLDEYEARTDYETLAGYVLDEETLLHRGAYPKKFTEMVCGYFERGIPWRYRDPQTLAKITQRRLEFRSLHRATGPDRRIDERQIPKVAEVIDMQTDRVRRLGLAALERTIEVLQSEPAYG